MQLDRRLYRTLFAVMGTVVYWVVALGIWVIFLLGTILGDCIGPEREACFHQRTIWGRAELIALPVIVAIYAALVIAFRRRWKQRLG
jgi:predicted histidine transporter YuiF (NhaC family)